MTEKKYEIVIEIGKVSHNFGENAILYDVNLKVIRGQIVALVGPSGCGKSTLLRAIVGTHPPKKGAIHVTANGTGIRRLADRPGADRGIVYQHYSLFPFLTACQNVAIGPMLDQTSLPFRVFRPLKWRALRKRHLEQAAKLLTKLKLADSIHRYPHELSGGMRQRVAIAQALIMKPEVLLLDEPFGALDEATREELQEMLLNIYSENTQAKARGESPPYTILIVTHELNEAIFVGDRVTAISRYWNWKEEGFDACPGATVVYDETAPIFQPGAEKDYAGFARQREAIRKAAFDPNSMQSRDENRRFWLQLREGESEKGNTKGES